jgi:hypothetical protein
MSSENELPKQSTTQQGIAGLPNGNNILSTLQKGFENGLPKELSDIYTKKGKAQIGSNLAFGNQKLKQSLAGAGGNVPIDALVQGQIGLQSGANESIASLNDTLAMRNQEAKDNYLARIYQLFGLGAGEANSANAYNMNKYQIDESNRFKWGDFLGSLAQGAGTAIAGGL